VTGAQQVKRSCGDKLVHLIKSVHPSGPWVPYSYPEIAAGIAVPGRALATVGTAAAASGDPLARTRLCPVFTR
jgi:hypothetical protein